MSQGSESFRALRFLGQFGFEEDPFASTNAAEEPRLRMYFVEPPYFESVMGDPAHPKSHVVLAPRGGGKTAQRRMIEDASPELNILCVTYDSFELPDKFHADDADWNYHGEQIARLLTVGILAKILDDEEAVERMSRRDKQHLRFYVERFVGSMTEEEFGRATRAIKSLPAQAAELWRRFGGPIRTVLNAVLQACHLSKVDFEEQQVDQLRDETLRFHLNRLIEIARALGFDSVYVLVDRVDELGLTATDAAKTLQFIHPLITDLPTLEAEGVAYKFFLWDQIEDEYRASSGRPDRVPIFTLAWSSDDLRGMISQRLKAFSDGRVSRLTDLICADVALDLDRLMAELAAGSPRDMIRMMARVVAEQTRTSDEATCIGRKALWDGIRSFSDERSEELISRYLGDIRRIGAKGRVTFTIPQIASDVFRITTQAARSKVQKWEQTGLVKKIGELLTGGIGPCTSTGRSTSVSRSPCSGLFRPRRSSGIMLCTVHPVTRS